MNKSCELMKSGETLLSSLNWWKFVCASNGKQLNADLRVPLKLHSPYRCSEPLHVIYRYCCVSSSHFICCTHFIPIYCNHFSSECLHSSAFTERTESITVLAVLVIECFNQGLWHWNAIHVEEPSFQLNAVQTYTACLWRYPFLRLVCLTRTRP